MISEIFQKSYLNWRGWGIHTGDPLVSVIKIIYNIYSNDTLSRLNEIIYFTSRYMYLRVYLIERL